MCSIRRNWILNWTTPASGWTPKPARRSTSMRRPCAPVTCNASARSVLNWRNNFARLAATLSSFALPSRRWTRWQATLRREKNGSGRNIPAHELAFSRLSRRRGAHRSADCAAFAATQTARHIPVSVAAFSRRIGFARHAPKSTVALADAAAALPRHRAGVRGLCPAILGSSAVVHAPRNGHRPRQFHEPAGARSLGGNAALEPQPAGRIESRRRGRVAPHGAGTDLAGADD